MQHMIEKIRLVVNNVVYYLADFMISALYLCVIYTLLCMHGAKDVPAHKP